MIFKNEFLPFIDVNKHVRDEQINQYIISATMIDLRAVLEKSKYEEIFRLYDLEKPATITSGIATIDDTTLLQNTNYCFVDASTFKGRLRFNIISSTELELVDAPNSLTNANLSKFIFFDLFEKIRPFLAYAAWIRYAQASKIQSTAAGLVQKELDFSQFVSDGDIGRYLNMLNRDKNFYQKELIQYLEPNLARKQDKLRNKIAYKVKKPLYPLL